VFALSIEHREERVEAFRQQRVREDHGHQNGDGDQHGTPLSAGERVGRRSCRYWPSAAPSANGPDEQHADHDQESD
jgi:hypothetical protein